jgi:predicted kinase
MKNIIEILVGIPASGKSTYAIEKVRDNSDYIRINRIGSNPISSSFLLFSMFFKI